MTDQSTILQKLARSPVLVEWRYRVPYPVWERTEERLTEDEWAAVQALISHPTTTIPILRSLGYTDVIKRENNELHYYRTYHDDNGYECVVHSVYAPPPLVVDVEPIPLTREVVSIPPPIPLYPPVFPVSGLVNLPNGKEVPLAGEDEILYERHHDSEYDQVTHRVWNSEYLEREDVENTYEYTSERYRLKDGDQ